MKRHTRTYETGAAVLRLPRYQRGRPTTPPPTSYRIDANMTPLMNTTVWRQHADTLVQPSWPWGRDSLIVRVRPAAQTKWWLEAPI